MADHCVTCPIIRPDSDPRRPHQPPVCESDRRILHRWLGDISNLIADLTNPEPPIINRRHYERFGVEYAENGQRRPISLGFAWADPVSALGGVSPINSRRSSPNITGSREQPLPINTAALDLKAPARVVNTGWPEDQIGNLSAATVLDHWIRAVRHWIHPDHHLPPATVTDMVAWLRTSTGGDRTRLDDICDQPEWAEPFTADIKHLRGALRAAAGATEARPEPCGIPCRKCDLMTLFRKDGDIECLNPDCQAVMRPEEYSDYIKTLAEQEKARRAASVA